jgi:superfamily II DNA or RNA helicase
MLARALTDYAPAVVASDSLDVGFQLARFRSGQTPVLIISAAYGEGIDGLQDVCRVLCFMSNGSANMRKQMIGRVFRHGQSRGVVVVDVVSDGTLDERQLALISEQEDLSESQVDKILAAEMGIE